VKLAQVLRVITLFFSFWYSQTHSALAEEVPPQKEPAMRQGLIAGGGLIGANAMGPAVLGGWWLKFPLASWAYLSGGPALSYVFNSTTHSMWFGSGAVESPNTDSQRILGLSLDSFLGIDMIRPLSLELGGNLGVASNAARSTYCGKETYIAGYGGLEGGFALRFGGRDQYMASVHGVAVTLPVLRCSNAPGQERVGDPIHVHMYHERDFETVGAVIRLGILL
jgi:hypothetical protein